MSGWKPIETAPKDGTIVLLYIWRDRRLKKGPIHAGRWYQPANPKSKGFWTQGGIYGPTHWMPLPEPPK